jgi:hypothetical protein
MGIFHPFEIEDSVLVFSEAFFLSVSRKPATQPRVPVVCRECASQQRLAQDAVKDPRRVPPQLHLGQHRVRRWRLVSAPGMIRDGKKKHRAMV